MGKKNEFVFNIGFNRENLDHVKVVRILNQKGRGKAEYLAKAVLSYEAGVGSVIAGGEGVDYQTLEGLVIRILMEQRGADSRWNIGTKPVRDHLEDQAEKFIVAEDEDVEGILQVLSGFRK